MTREVRCSGCGHLGDAESVDQTFLKLSARKATTGSQPFLLGKNHDHESSRMLTH